MSSNPRIPYQTAQNITTHNDAIEVSTANLKILSWNANSISAHGDELKQFLNTLAVRPDVICLQETRLKPNTKFVLHGYSVVRKDRPDRPAGGVATFIRNGINYTEIETGCENIEYVTIEIQTSKRKLTISNIYIPPTAHATENDFKRFFERGNTILVGDFNAHHSVFGSTTVNPRGRLLNQMIDQYNFAVLSTGACTYTSHNGSESPIDLALSSRNLGTVSNWTVLRDQLGSDHFPTITTLDELAVSEETSIPRWSFKRADWKNFKAQCQNELADEKIDINHTRDVDEIYAQFVSTLLDIANNNIPKSKPRPNQRNVPYWTDACQSAVDDRNRALRRMRQTKSPDDCLEYRRCKGIAQRTIKEAKRSSWRNYCEKLNTRTKMSEVWRTTKRMNGVDSAHNIPNLKLENQTFETNLQKAEIFATVFSKVSSDTNYTPEFIANRATFQPEYPTTHPHLDESLDDEFSLFELEQALKQCKRNSSPGQDTIAYEILKEIPKSGLRTMLQIFNVIWEKGKLPAKWKEALITPILKPTKPNNDPSSYRPISLTSSICKIMERLIANRLCWYIERNHLFNKNQSGFRRNRACIDQIMRIQDDVNKALRTKSNVVGLFIDLEKAFDMVWKDGLLQKLRNIGIQKRMHDWIEDFLTDRTIQVRVGNQLSRKVRLENGTPQGSVLSPVLFLIMFNDVPDTDNRLKLSIFADDCSIWKAGPNIQHNTMIVQKYFDRFQAWCDKWGVRISKTKTTAMIFSNKQNEENSVHLKIKGDEIKFEKQVKFLGMILDQRLTWTKHINYIIDRCNRRLNILRALSGTDWGTDKKTMTTLYRTLIRSIMEYGSIAYDSASKSTKEMLNAIQSKALRICCGAMISTSNDALQIECGEIPLQLRRDELQLQYAAKLHGSSDNPTKEILQDCWHNHAPYPSGKEPFSLKVAILPTIVGNTDLLTINEYSNDAFWERTVIYTDVTLSGQFEKSKSDMEKKKMTEKKVLEYSEYIQAYTDASKRVDSKTGISFNIPSLQIQRRIRLPDNTTILTAEATAILHATRYLSDIDTKQNAAIFTDSLETVNAIQSSTTKASASLINDIQTTIDELQRKNNVQIHIVWIPGHTGIHGNEKAHIDSIAATNQGEIEIIPHISMKDAKKLIEKHIDNIWQERWNSSTKGRHYFQIQPEVNRKVKCSHVNRKIEVIRTRLRLGKARLNQYLHQINQHIDGLCSTCRVPETIEHFVLHCKENKDMISHITRICTQHRTEVTLQKILACEETMDIIVKNILDTKRNF